MTNPREKSSRRGDWFLDHFAWILGLMMAGGMILIAVRNGVGSCN